MARRKRKSQLVFALPRRHYVRRRARTNIGLGTLFLAGIVLLLFFLASYPLEISLVVALWTSIFAFFGRWAAVARRRTNANQAAFSDLYHNSTPRSFEQRVAELFRIQGYHASVNGGAN